MFDTIGGLPVHALIVHLVVIALPTASLALAAMALWPTGSRRYGAVVSLLAAVGLAAAVVARLSGWELAKRVGPPADHISVAQILPWFALAQLVLTIVLWLIDRGAAPRPTGGKAFAALAFLGALLTLAWTIRAGHSGAEAVWGQIIANT